jgi:surface-anchored protein
MNFASTVLSGILTPLAGCQWLRACAALLAAVACCGSSALSAGPAATVSDEHIDLRIVYQPGSISPLSLIAYDRDDRITYPADTVILQVNESARIPLPAGTPFGAEGDPLWVLPQAASADLLHLGVSAEGITPGIFTSRLTLTLVSKEGPGHFLAWQAGPLGFEIRLDSRDGLGSEDSVNPLVGSHDHLNWGFTSPGVYQIGFQVSGTLTSSGERLVGEPVVFTFHVLPLPAGFTYPDWQARHWPNDPSASSAAPGSDPDGDGILNILEYAFGRDPLQADQTPLWTLSIEDGAPRIRFVRSTRPTDLLFAVEAAPEITGPWTTLINLQTEAIEGDREQVTVLDSLSVTQRFYRIQIQFR